jgi:DNA repair protein RecN (Recombination protein N)
MSFVPAKFYLAIGTMLTTLRIKNFALVADLTVEFQAGYNVITGETGAGKSILIGALSLVLGERADRTLIRSGSDNCCVEAVFDADPLKTLLEPFLEENGLEPCDGSQLVLKRTFTNSGVNRQFVNGSPTTLSVLAALGEMLVDIHGPHEHQSLLHPSQQLAILDAFGGLDADRQAFGDLVRKRASLGAEKAALIVDEKTYAQQLDLLRFQVEEIGSARLQLGEDEQLEQDHRRASNAARLVQLGQAGLELLSENETSILAQAGIIGRTLHELQRLDNSANPLLNLHQQNIALLHELRGELSRYIDKVEVDPAGLRQMEERLDLLHSLKRKYGTTLAEVIGFAEEARRKLHGLEQRDADLARINGELQKLALKMWEAGQLLSGKRRKLLPQLGKATARHLADLGFKQSRFDVELTTLSQRDFTENPIQLSHSGFDSVEFQFSPNPGEPAKPLRAIASSGEIARVMLALKTVLAAQDQIPVLVFDEVDANIGGETAHAVGEKMQQIARKRQVLCITHLAQVAAPAAAHYVATKLTKAGRTTSEITLLKGADRMTELARMLGGQTDASRKHAQELLDRKGPSSG